VEEEGVNLRVGEEGWGEAYLFPSGIKYRGELLTAEEEARRKHGGCEWSEDRQREEQEEKEITSACQAAGRIGELVVIEGQVVDSYHYEDIAVFLNFGGAYPEQCLTAVIWAKDWPRFAKSPETWYNGREVRISGEIIEYEGRPEIILTDPEQIEIIN